MGLAVEIDTRLKVRCTGLERVLSFGAAIDVPVSEIEGVRVIPRHWPSGLRILGTGFLGLVVYGWYRTPSGGEFWRVYQGQRAVEITLRSGRFSAQRCRPGILVGWLGG